MQTSHEYLAGIRELPTYVRTRQKVHGRAQALGRTFVLSFLPSSTTLPPAAMRPPCSSMSFNSKLFKTMCEEQFNNKTQRTRRHTNTAHHNSTCALNNTYTQAFTHNVCSTSGR